MPEDTVEQTPVPGGELGSTETETEGSTPDDGLDNLYERPDFRAFQSKTAQTHAKQIQALEGRIAELQQMVAESSLTARQYEARSKAIENALDTLGAGPDQKLLVQQFAELEELRAEKEMRTKRDQEEAERRQGLAAVAKWKGEREDYARRKGVDPKDPIFQQALDDALVMQNEALVFDAIDEMRAKKSAGQKSEETQEQEVPRQRPQPGVPPPSGGGSRTGSAAEKQRLQERFDAEIKGARSSNEKVQIRRKYRQMGLQI